MRNKIRDLMEKLARKTARNIRSKTAISGWHEDDSLFPECKFDDVVDMLMESSCGIVTYHADDGDKVVVSDSNGVSFVNGNASFSDGHNTYLIPVGKLVSIV